MFKRKHPLPTGEASSRPDAAVPEVEHLLSIIEDLRTRNEDLLESQSILESSRDEYVDLFESAALPSLTLDRRGIIRAVNRAAVDLFGMTSTGLVGLGLSQLIAARDRAIFVAYLDRCRQAELSEICEVHLRALEGGDLFQLCSRRAPRDLTALHMTISNLKLRERDRVERAQLLEAAEAARKASDAKDTFIAMLSHELRTPLTPVLVAASALERQADLPATLRGVFAMIVRNVQMEARLVDDLLDVTRIVQGKMKIERVSSDLHQTVRASCETLAPEALKKRQNLWLELKATQTVADVDPIRMQQLFGNLVKNAIKFSPMGGEIRVRSWNEPSTIVVEVEDTGVGLDPTELPRLFEPFNQLERAEHRATGMAGGLGLGLTICRGIVELHGGTLEASSQGRGRGARFVVQLPVSRSQAATEAAPLARAPEPAHRDKRRILLVEDNLDSAEMMTDLLVAEGYEVANAATVQGALAVDLETVDVIVSDIGLPDGSGLDLIRKIQSAGHRPAIALSGFGMGSDVQASVAAGFDIHLTKPVTFDRLLGTIRTLEVRSKS